jgi:hypothetical protein
MAAKLILVEPDEEQRDQFKNAIKGSAFEVSEYFNTNAEAVEFYKETKAHPHLLVLRVVSGKQGAAAALDELHRISRNVKAVVSYDVRSTHLLMSAYSHGAVAAIKQPFRLHRVVEKLTFAIASERHDALGGPIVRLEHPVEVRYKTGSLFSFPKTGFCERLGLTDMDLNVERSFKPKTELKLDLLLPPPSGTLKLLGVVEDIEMTRPKSWCVYLALKNVSSDVRAAIEGFLVKAAKKI